MVLAQLPVASALPVASLAQEQYRFDVAEVEKRPFTYGGFLQGLATRQRLNSDAALYRLQFHQNPREQLDASELRVHLDLGYQAGWLGAVFRGEAVREDSSAGVETDSTVQEAYLTAQPAPVFTLDVGKRVARWGKGYAWNPIAFVDRPKNPDDPELSQEGFVMARAVAIRSLPGALKTVDFTLVALPVREQVNDDFGAKEADNLAAKLYLLLWDTDLDLAVLSGGTRSWRYGVDFSRNITSNFEVHGEWALLGDLPRAVLEPNGAVTQQARTAQSWLAGIRYLTESELTAIVEVYHNGAGYTADELTTFYRYVDEAYARFQAGQPAMLQRAQQLLKGAYGQPNPGRDYGYLRVSQKEPFGWLYLTPALTITANLQDRSTIAMPELIYAGVTNLELRLRLAWLAGARFSDYGERPTRTRADLRVRYSF
ncbi:MAG: hypothetical protein HY423_07345 [Candidatus Lambdaproteobacteria bacterium]|nr:hypothetical protein [Candidatus Lambdaproteobacteria bacterium]